MKLKAVDLFSGCGGLTLGLTQGGFRVLAAIEIDPLAVETYKANHKRVVVWEKDIRRISAVEFMRRMKTRRGQLDLLAGCPPCQGFSAMTTRNGHHKPDDKRNDLVFHFLRFVRVLRPKAVMMENVPGLARDQRLPKIVAALERMGYQVTKAVLNASKYGVPQRRKRFILLAAVKGRIDYSPPARRTRTVRQAFEDLYKVNPRGDPLQNLREIRDKRVSALIRRIPKDGGSRTDLPPKWQLKCHKECDGFRDVYGRMSWDDVAPTITSGCINPSKGRFLHPEKNRAINLREAAVLQGFPPKYIFPLTRGKYAVAQMLGNAVPPPFSRMQAAAIWAFLEKTRPQPDP
jgi:DNA (cytosine-5)-methyltransferase 1